MYLEIDEGFDEHPKTVRLCRVLGDVNAGQYLIRLWAWACRSAQDGDLSGMEAADVEQVAKYKASDGLLFKALTEIWSPKFGPWIDAEDRTLRLHGWNERQGASIKRMEKRAERMRNYRAGSKPSRDGHVEGTCEPRNMTVQTSPDKTRQGEAKLPPIRIRPDCACNLETCLRVAIQREQPQVGMWIPGRFSYKDADKLFGDLGDVPKALPEIERKIELFAKDPSMQPWTVAKFVDKFNEIGLRKLEFGRAPQPEPARRTTAVKEW
jgi:hypothetical protein